MSEQGGAATVLVVDDDADYRLLVRLGLDGAPGFAPVLEAAGVTETGDVLRNHPVDVLLLDVSLPGAFELGSRLVGDDGGPKLVLVSSRPPEELSAVAAAAGAVGYLGKDMAPTELPAAIADLTRLVDRLQEVLAKASGRLPADPRSAGAARRLVRQTLEGWCDEQQIDEIALCASEMVTNAVVHAGSGPRVLVQIRPAVVHVEISDDSDTTPVPRSAGPEDTSGRGMSILGALSDRWGTRRRSGGGNTVWFDVGRGVGGAGGRGAR